MFVLIHRRFHKPLLHCSFDLHRYRCLLISATFATRKPISSPSSSATGATPWMFLMRSFDAPKNHLNVASPSQRPSHWPSGVMIHLDQPRRVHPKGIPELSLK